MLQRIRNWLMAYLPFFRNLSVPIKPMPIPPGGTPPVGVTPDPSPGGETPPPLNLRALAYAHLVGKYNGQFVNVDRNPYGAQCVEIVQAWCDILGIERFPGNAADFQFDAHPDCDWIANSPTNFPEIGSIVVFHKSANLPFGHVGVSGVADSMRFTSFDQNWPLGSPAHQQGHTYNGVAGWLTPIFSHIKYRPPGTAPAPEPAPVPAGAHYRVTARAGLVVHDAPHLGSGRIGLLSYNTVVTIACQIYGDDVSGSRIWDHIVAPVDGFVSDYWIDTPVTGAFSPGIGRCPSEQRLR
jgi:hypothetical protein